MTILLKTNETETLFTLTLANKMSDREATVYIHKELCIGCKIVKFM